MNQSQVLEDEWYRDEPLIVILGSLFALYQIETGIAADLWKERGWERED